MGDGCVWVCVQARGVARWCARACGSGARGGHAVRRLPLTTGIVVLAGAGTVTTLETRQLRVAVDVMRAEGARHCMAHGLTYMAASLLASEPGEWCKGPSARRSPLWWRPPGLRPHLCAGGMVPARSTTWPRWARRTRLWKRSSRSARSTSGAWRASASLGLASARGLTHWQQTAGSPLQNICSASPADAWRKWCAPAGPGLRPGASRQATGSTRVLRACGQDPSGVLRGAVCQQHC